MPDYTFLVIGQEIPGKQAVRGKISSMQEGDGVWGRKETSPRFEKIPFNGDRKAANWVHRLCEYDFDQECFVHLDTKDVFDSASDVVSHESDFSDQVDRDRDLVELLTDVGEILAPCSALRASFITDFEGDERSYWAAKYFPFRKRPKVKALIEAAKYGGYSDCRAAFRGLNTQTRQDILTSMRKRDRKYLRWLYVANNSAEAEAIDDEPDE